MKIQFLEIDQRNIEIGWTNEGRERTIHFLCAELVGLIHDNIEVNHELDGCYYDTLDNYYARVKRGNHTANIDLPYYTRNLAMRHQRKLLPILDEIYEEMIIEDFVLV